MMIPKKIRVVNIVLDEMLLAISSTIAKPSIKKNNTVATIDSELINMENL